MDGPTSRVYGLYRKLGGNGGKDGPKRPWGKEQEGEYGVGMYEIFKE